jgi:hypothetical protein
MRHIQPVDYKFEKVVKPTDFQIKKYYTMFSPTEKALLECCVSNMSKNHLLILDHARTHIPSLTHSIAKETLMDCNVIEFNINQKNGLECRVLVRGNKIVPIKTDRGIENGNICMVVDIKNNKLVSAYINGQFDSHKNLDMGRYNESLNIIKYAMELN